MTSLAIWSEGAADPLPRILPDDPDPAPVAATLPDGTPHPDPLQAERGWQARGGIYVRVSAAGSTS